MTVTDEYTNGSIVNVNTVSEGESFFKDDENANWVDTALFGNIKTPRIKAFTVNATGTQPTPTPQKQTVIHNFTTDGLASSTFSITGNIANKRTPVQYNGMTLTNYLKMETATNISFTTSGKAKITLICGDDSNNCGIKIDGNTYAVQNGQVSLDLNAGTHTIKKSNKNVVIFYMILEQ